MHQNAAHEIVAKKVIEQVKQALIPSVNKAAIEVGYRSGSGTHIAKSATFQKALLSHMPYEWLAAMQSKQAQAFRLKVITVDKDEDIDELCNITGYELVATREVLGGMKLLVKIPDWEYRDRALDKCYKLFGLYTAEKHELVRPLDEMTDKELYDLVNQDQSLDSPQPEATIVELPSDQV